MYRNPKLPQDKMISKVNNLIPNTFLGTMSANWLSWQCLAVCQRQLSFLSFMAGIEPISDAFSSLASINYADEAVLSRMTWNKSDGVSRCSDAVAGTNTN